ncbi:hypothetical protein JNM05_13810 [bacterium]|nr:hypothetical protein [bacterium]
MMKIFSSDFTKYSFATIEQMLGWIFYQLNHWRPIAQEMFVSPQDQTHTNHQIMGYLGLLHTQLGVTPIVPGLRSAP